MNPIPNYDGSRPEPPYTTEREECDRLRSELDAARAELARVRESVVSVLSSWDSGRIKVEPEGCCMCGSTPHGGHDGHEYYDMAEYYVGKAFDKLRAELARMGEP